MKLWKKSDKERICFFEIKKNEMASYLFLFLRTIIERHLFHHTKTIYFSKNN